MQAASGAGQGRGWCSSVSTARSRRSRGARWRRSAASRRQPAAPDGCGAGEKVLVAHVSAKGRPRGDVPRLGRAHLEQTPREPHLSGQRPNPPVPAFGRQRQPCRGTPRRPVRLRRVCIDGRGAPRRTRRLPPGDDRPGNVDPVAVCRPLHPGIPFTSSTNTVPSFEAAGPRRRNRRRRRLPRASRPATQDGGSIARADPPRETLVRQSPAGARRSIAPTTRPPTTKTEYRGRHGRPHVARRTRRGSARAIRSRAGRDPGR